MNKEESDLQLIKGLKVKLFCSREKHDWKYYTWGSAVVDNLDGTFGLWEIPVRDCPTCKKHQYNLKNAWEDAKKCLTIKDLQ